MIYLIDNSKKMLDKFQENYGGTFADIFYSSYHLGESKETFPELDNADFLIIHKNYYDKDDRNRFQEIIDYCDSKGIEYIAFSGNKEGKDIINKKSMYENLYDFLQFYRKNKVPNRNILIYGINSVFDKLIIKYDSIKKDLIQKDKREQLFLTKTIKEKLKEFLTLLNYSHENVSKTINNLTKKSFYTNENFLDKLDNLLEKEIIRFNEISNNSK